MDDRLLRGLAQAYRWTIAGAVAAAVTQIPREAGIGQYIGGLLGVLFIMLLAAVFSAYVIQPFDPDTEAEAFWSEEIQ